MGRIIIMNTQLIARIRAHLSINPNSKSTLITKPQLLTYATLIHQQCLQFQSLLQPYNPASHAALQTALQQQAITLGSCESALKQARHRNEVLKSTLAQQRSFLKQAEKVLEEHESQITDLEEKLSGKQVRSLEDLDAEGEGDGENAIVLLMKDFINFRGKEGQDQI